MWIINKKKSCLAHRYLFYIIELNLSLIQELPGRLLFSAFLKEPAGAKASLTKEALVLSSCSWASLKMASPALQHRVIGRSRSAIVFFLAGADKKITRLRNAGWYRRMGKYIPVISCFSFLYPPSPHLNTPTLSQLMSAILPQEMQPAAFL